MSIARRLKEKLRELKPLLESEYKVKSIGFFGSYARGEEREDSDVDILVEFSEPIGLLKFVELEDFLTEELGVKVDLVMKSALKPRVRERVLREAVYV